MLHCDQEAPIPHHVRYWSSRAGYCEFRQMIFAICGEYPPAEETMRAALEACLVGAAFINADEFSRRVAEAVYVLVLRAAGERERTARFVAHLREPAPSRPDVVIGQSDRGGAELAGERRFTCNPFFARYLEAKRAAR